MGSSGTLLIVSTLNEIFKSNNIAQEVTANQIALNSIPIAVISVIVGIGYALWYDRKLKNVLVKSKEEKNSMLEIDWNTSTILAEVFYCIIGLIFAFTGVNALKIKKLKTNNNSNLLVYFSYYFHCWALYSYMDYRSMYYCFSYLNCYWFSTTSSNAYSYC